MKLATCPQQQRLGEYVAGGLDALTHEAVEAHLDECSECQSTLAELDRLSGPPLVRLLGKPALSETPPDDPTFRQMVARARSLGAGPVCGPGTVLDEYELIEPLGAGGMGRVFRARHRRMKRDVALKVLAPELLRSPAARQRFQREVESAGRLSHPHIVTAHDAREDHGRLLLVMELVEGRDLAAVVRDGGPLPVDRALDCIVQAARGLAHAHASGLVHRDVKPANLIVDAAGTVKVLDLGLAAALEAKDGPAELTAEGVPLGTAAYMAPEQATDPAGVGPAADVYALGCTLYFLLTGRPPHQGATTLATLLAHRDRPMPSLRAARPDCPAAIEALFRRMTAPAPADRPSMAEVVATAPRTGDVSRRVKPRTWPFLMAGAAAAAVLAWLAFARPGDPQPEPERYVAQTGSTPKKPAVPVVDMVLVSKGEFEMGSPDTDRDAAEDERPRHTVAITRPFRLGKTEITQQQYQEVMGTNPSAFSERGSHKDKVKGADTRSRPVESVSWIEAVRFCNRLSERHGLQPYYQIGEGDAVTIRGGTGYRLPTEAEWEYACRAGSQTRWCSGEDVKALAAHSWTADNSAGTTHPVGSKKPNAWGLYDMHGNVPEWCWDRYDMGYYRNAPAADPPGPGKGPGRVFRGGGWSHRPAQVRSAARDGLGVHYSVLTVVGLRVARNVD